jgi:3-dehydroquinate dehydratase II
MFSDLTNPVAMLSNSSDNQYVLLRESVRVEKNVPSCPLAADATGNVLGAGLAGPEMTKILLVQGANLTFLGRREPAIYGTTTPQSSTPCCSITPGSMTTSWRFSTATFEGEAINRIYRAVDEGFDGLVMNPAGFTYAGFALKDCVKGAGLPYVEVHISNIAKRGIQCVLSDAAEGFITGFGMHSYTLGLEAMLEILRGPALKSRS